jgi:hypothetical protein
VDGENAASSSEELNGNPADIDIGFNGGPDQFDYFADFFGASSIHPGRRLCHTYVHWNVAQEPPAMGNARSPGGSRALLEYWLKQAEGRCDEALISFQGEKPGNPPSDSAVSKAFADFLATPWARETGFTGRFAFTPWNEPNNPAGSGNGLGKVIPPELAAAYYLTMAHQCASHGCEVAAGDFASNGNTWNDFEWNCANDNIAPSMLCHTPSSENPDNRPASYLDRYKNYIANHTTEHQLPEGFRPKAFAFHAWRDVNEYLHTGSHCSSYGDCTTRRLLTSLGGSWGGVQIWDTEVGVDQDAAPISNGEQACGAAFLVRLSALSPRITRVYYTRLHGGTGELLDGHVARPALDVLARRETSYGKECK